jgi:hypothetical protein
MFFQMFKNLLILILKPHFDRLEIENNLLKEEIRAYRFTICRNSRLEIENNLLKEEIRAYRFTICRNSYKLFKLENRVFRLQKLFHVDDKDLKSAELLNEDAGKDNQFLDHQLCGCEGNYEED